MFQTNQNTYIQRNITANSAQYSTQSLDRQIQNIFLLKPPPGSKQHVVPRDAVKNAHDLYTQNLSSPQIQTQKDIPHDPLNLGAQAEILSPIMNRLQDRLLLQQLLQNQVQQQLPLTQQQQYGNVNNEKNTSPHVSYAQSTSGSTPNINYYQPQIPSANNQSYHITASDFSSIKNASGSYNAQSTSITTNVPVQNTFSTHNAAQSAQRASQNYNGRISTDPSPTPLVFPNLLPFNSNPVDHTKPQTCEQQIGGNFQRYPEPVNFLPTTTPKESKPEQFLPSLQNNPTFGSSASIYGSYLGFQTTNKSTDTNANTNKTGSAFSTVRNCSAIPGSNYKIEANLLPGQISSNPFGRIPQHPNETDNLGDRISKPRIKSDKNYFAPTGFAQVQESIAAPNVPLRPQMSNTENVRKSPDAYSRPNLKHIYEKYGLKHSNSQQARNMDAISRLFSSTVDLRTTSPPSHEGRYIEKLTRQSRLKESHQEQQSTKKANSQWDLRAQTSSAWSRTNLPETGNRTSHLEDSKKASYSIADLRCLGKPNREFGKSEQNCKLQYCKFAASTSDLSPSKQRSSNTFEKLKSQNFVDDGSMNLGINNRLVASMVDLRLSESGDSNSNTKSQLNDNRSKDKFLLEREKEDKKSRALHIDKLKSVGPIRNSRKSVVVCDLLEKINDYGERAMKRRKYSNTQIPDYIRDRVRPIKRTHSYKLCEDKHYLTILDQLREHCDPMWRETLEVELGLSAKCASPECITNVSLRPTSSNAEKKSVSDLAYLSHEPRNLLKVKLKHAKSLMNLSPGKVDSWRGHENRVPSSFVGMRSSDSEQRAHDNVYHTIHAGMQVPNLKNLFRPQSIHEYDVTGTDADTENSSTEGSSAFNPTDDYERRMRSSHNESSNDIHRKLNSQNTQWKSNLEIGNVPYERHKDKFHQQRRNSFDASKFRSRSRSATPKRHFMGKDHGANSEMLDIMEEKYNYEQKYKDSSRTDSPFINTHFPAYLSKNSSFSYQNQFQNVTPLSSIDHNVFTSRRNSMVSGATASQRAAQPHQNHVVNRVRPPWLKRKKKKI